MVAKVKPAVLATKSLITRYFMLLPLLTARSCFQAHAIIKIQL